MEVGEAAGVTRRLRQSLTIGTLEHSAEGHWGSTSLLLTSAQFGATTHFDFDSRCVSITPTIAPKE